MKNYDTVTLVAAIVILILFILFFYLAILYFAPIKAEKKRISITDANGAKIALDVELANNITTRAKGLMGRTSLAENAGMLFVFDRSGIYPFWMFNTSISLDAIHIAENGTVVDIIEMEPCGLNITACKRYPPRTASKYVLEVNRGFSKRYHIEIDKSRLIFPDQELKTRN